MRITTEAKFKDASFITSIIYYSAPSKLMCVFANAMRGRMHLAFLFAFRMAFWSMITFTGILYLFTSILIYLHGIPSSENVNLTPWYDTTNTIRLAINWRNVIIATNSVRYLITTSNNHNLNRFTYFIKKELYNSNQTGNLKKKTLQTN